MLRCGKTPEASFGHQQSVSQAGAREGLNVEGAGMDPTFEELNKRTVINQQFQWDNRMYLWPIQSSEVYSDPQLIQSPGY